MMRKIIAFFIERSLLVNLATISLFIAGAVIVTNMNREVVPKVEYGYVIVATAYPGASAEDIEKHVTIPVENQLREVDGIEEVNSTSYESSSVVGCKLDPDVENKDKTINDIKNAIDQITDLPEDAEDTIVTELSTSMFSVIQISVVNKKGIKSDHAERQLRKYTRILEDKLLDIPGVARVSKLGYRDREMIIEVHPHLLDKYHVAVNEIIQALSKKNLNFPGGLVKSNNEDILIRTIGEVENAADIRSVLIRANDSGNTVRLGDVATVKDSFEKAAIKNKISGEEAITLNVLKKESADIITLVENIKKETSAFSEKYGESYKLVLSNDASLFVKRSLSVLKNNGFLGIILVILALFITLGWRISFVTALGLPLAFCGAFLWMGQAGITINQISLLGLIIVLGMLVDDAIVVAENIYHHLEKGKSPKEAVLDGTSEVILPIAGTILTTIAAFAPIMFMGGVFEKFFWTFPAVITVALIASWLESMFILPSHVYDIEKKRKKSVLQAKQQKKGGGIFERIKNRYAKILRVVLNNKYKVAGLIAILFIGTMMFAASNLKFILFPQGDIDILIIRAEAENGTTLEGMNNKLRDIEKIVAVLPPKEMENYITRAGIIRENPVDPGQKRGSNYGMLMVNLTPEDSRERKTPEIIKYLRKEARGIEKNFVKLEFDFIKTGPPTEEPVKVTIRGEDLEAMRKVGDKYKEYLEKIEGLKDVKDDYEDGKKELKIYINEKNAAIAGISVFDVASTVRSCFEGTVATKIKKSDEEIDLRVIFSEKLRNNLASLKRIKVANKLGNLVPLSEIARYEFGRSITFISRKDRKRAVRVTANIDEKAKKVTSLYVNNLLINEFKDIEKNNPGILVSYEGEFKDTQESMQKLARSFLIAVLIIYLILVSLFRSLSHPLVIMGVIPLTAIGVIWAFYFHNLPLSFMAMLGVVGLGGVVVNDSIVLVDFIKKGRARGLSPKEASIEAGGNRLRAVFLTTITTFLGVIPTAYGFGGFEPTIVPMAVAMAWGLAFGTMITLFATPILYNIISDARKLFFREHKPAEAFAAQHYQDHEPEERIKHDIEQELKEELKDELEESIEETIEEKIEQDKIFIPGVPDNDSGNGKRKRKVMNWKNLKN
ncbi:MAG: efflux RND transporter permease subunit [bacterium]|nr:efflux RND transporter permease subunit [bacterium]